MINDSKLTFLNAATQLYFMSAPKYECPVHGVHEIGVISLWVRGEKVSSHCMLCYIEWMKANVFEVKEQA